MARWTVNRITSIPTVSESGSDDPVWYPLQHALGIETFGVNLFVASRPDQMLVDEHDERLSGQQELYVVLEGAAVFDLDGEQVDLDRGAAVAVTEPSVRRSARALIAGTTMLIIGAGSEAFRSTWNPAHFSDIPRPD
jgi:uncharacterized cupin superfamily protein